MNRYVLVYLSLLEHLQKGLVTPNEFVVLVGLVLTAGWNEQRPDYARIERNVAKLHREHFRDETTGHEVWTRQGLDKLIKSLVAKGYVEDEGAWWFIPNYKKWQDEVPSALKAQRTSQKGAQQKATPVANSLVEGTQEKATPVAGVQPPLHMGATPVAQKATPVAQKATPVAHEGVSIGATSGEPAPSIMSHSTISPINPPNPPEGEDREAEEEKLRNRLEVLFSRELQTTDLGRADYRHIRSIIDRKIPFELVEQVVADCKRAFKPKHPGDRIRSVGWFMQELEARLAVPSAPVPTGGEAVASAPRSRYSQAYERARQGYYERRFSRENPKAATPGIHVQKLLQSGCWDAEFQDLIRVEAATVERMVATSKRPELERRHLITTQHPLAELAAELARTEGVA